MNKYPHLGGIISRDSQMLAAVIFIYVVIIVSVILIVQALAAQRRKKMAAYAQTQGWSFSPAKDKKMEKRYPAFKCLRRGHSRYAYNIMRGQRDESAVTAFDYHYVTGHGKNRRTHNFSTLIIRSPVLLKPLYIRPEHIFDKMSDFFGFNDIDFESAEFSRKFYVKAEEKRWAYDIIHQRMMEFLMESPKFHIQFDPDNIMVYRNKRFQEPDFDAAFSLIHGILNRMPDYVRQQQMESVQTDNKPK